MFGRTTKEAPHDADSVNARLLTQAGFINQLMAGVYTYLPLGLRVLNKIKNIVREEMDGLGASEVYMPALTPKELWETTNRWDKIDVMFKLEGHGNKEYALGSTHEEVVTPLVAQYVKSYKDFPVAIYQIQDKYRNEPRAKSGLLRGREFSMKDLYSFHLTEEDFSDFYERAKKAYLKVFSRCGLDAKVVEASGGVFTKKFSHEFQVLSQNGEDTIYLCDCGFAQNREIAQVKEGSKCPKCGGAIREEKAIEVGNIFPLETRFTKDFGFNVQEQDNTSVDVIMGCYGIGPSRVMGSIVEIYNDEMGMMWPKNVAPFHVHLATLASKDIQERDRIVNAAADLHDKLEGAGIEVLWDDREDVRAGEKFADADLIGIPLRLVVSQKTLAEGAVEWKERNKNDVRMVKIEEVLWETKTWLDS
jgi:prolyl-tRNA synthetase